MSAELLQQAAQLAQGQQPERARPLIARLLQSNPRNADALTLLGIVEQRTGNAAAALDAFGLAREHDPLNPARIGNHAVALKQAGRYDEAIAAFEASLAMRPGAPVALTNLGSCLIAANRPAEAEVPLRAAVAAKPDHSEAWNNLGVALARTGRREDACGAYGRALVLRPNYVEAALNRCDALLALGRHEETEAAVREVLSAHPGHPRAANLLAQALDERGDLPGAIAVYRHSLEREGLNHPIGINLVMALLRAGDPAGALAMADELLASLPSVTTPLALKCAALERLGRAAELAELMGVDRFVKVIDVDNVPGFASVAEFNTALEIELRAHPSLTFEPEGLVTRSGRQSDELAHDTSPAIAALAALAKRNAAAHAATLVGEDHPFLLARPERWDLTLWGTILQPGGAVESHIHAPNWMSGVYYPVLPDMVGAGDEGWFAIGALPERLGGGGTLRKMEPAVGRMILFPSYLWHCTLPFGGSDDRISLAFDLMPEGIGQPHRLRA